MRHSFDRLSRPKTNKSFTEINHSPFRNTLQKQTQPLLKKDQDEFFSAVAPIKMMGGLEASQISS